LLIIYYIGLIFCIFMMFRNLYTNIRMREGSHLVFKYLTNLDFSEFDDKVNYYDEMKIGYVRYLFSLHLWGKNSAIKSKYIKLLVK